MESTAPYAEASRGRRITIFVIAVVLGSAVAAVGWLVPSQFKSLPVSVLAEAGRRTPDLSEGVDEQLDAGRSGLAVLLAEAAAAIHYPTAEQLAAEVADYQSQNPDLAVWGEANPYLTGAFSPEAVRNFDPTAGVIRHFLPRGSRRAIETFLQGSRNATTQAVLSTRSLSSYRQFLPVFSAGGAPLEATILLTAMLVQSDGLGPAATRELRALAEDANRTGDASQIELIYLDLLSLGSRYNWGQLAGLTRGAESLETLAEIRHLLQVNPDSAPQLAATIILSGQADAVAEYVIHYGPRGVEALNFALYHGKGSVDLLLRQDLPPDGDVTVPPTGEMAAMPRSAIDPLVRFALHQPTLAVVTKIAAYLVGGFLIFVGVERVTALRRIVLSPLFAFSARLVGAAVVCLFLVVINEPYLARGSQPAGFELRLVIPVLGATSSETMPESSTLPIDMATMLSIAFFFMLQMLVYLICLLKLREIEGKPVHPLVKLRLAENEENLFDSGLYVGIAGTCVSLVLQVLNIIEANLLAAYSSNLFGILCVAFVKIRHVRPFKQRLIMNSEEALASKTVLAG